MSKFFTIDSTTQATIEATASNGDAYFNTDSSEIWVWDTTLATPDWRKYASSGLANTFLNEFSTLFNATTDYLNVTSSAESVQSLSFWINPTSNVTNLSTSQTFMGLAYGFTPGVGNFSAASGTYQTVTPILGMYVSGSGTMATPGVNGMPSTITANTWHHVFLNWTSSLSVDNAVAGYEIYFDGQLVTADLRGTPAAYSLAANSKIGARTDGSKNFSGYMDEVAVWNTDASSHIAEIYNSGNGPTNLMGLATQPVHWWRMGDLEGLGAGDTVVQITDRGTDGTAHATPQSTTTTIEQETP